MGSAIFDPEFFTVSGETIELRLIDTYEGGNGALPFYWWDIILRSENKAIGKISFRIGHNEHSYYNGNIGYEIDEEYRGNHFSLLACRLILPCAKRYRMDRIYLTCDHDNMPSRKIIEKLGGILVEEAVPPKDYIFYYEGIKKHRIYELRIDE